jgi:splicing factor U2AF subunit
MKERIAALAALQQQQQQHLQQQMLQQQLILAQQKAMAGLAAATQNQQGNTKKQREVYIGNLTIGVVNEQMLRQLFNGALSSLVADPENNPPVVSCQLDPTCRFAFVELRTEGLATAAMNLDKVIHSLLPICLH